MPSLTAKNLSPKFSQREQVIGALSLRRGARTGGASCCIATEIEREAGAFAPAFLMPTSSVIAHAVRNHSLSILMKLSRGKSLTARP